MRMVRGRIETTPSEQLVALRKARDHYVALAESLKENLKDPERPEEHEREREARRIAKAYDKSIANMVVKMVRAGAPTRSRALLNNLGMARPIFAVAVCSLALFALIYAGQFEARQGHADIPSKPAASRVAPQSMPALPKPQGGPKITSSRPLAPSPNTKQKAQPLRATAVAEQSHPAARPASLVASQAKKPADDGGDGFVAKVLQPDGTFKEEYFSASPPQPRQQTK